MARYKPKSPLKIRLGRSRYILTLLLSLLLIRVFYIQIIKGDDYSNRVGRQQTLRIPINRVSGHITDRNGIPFTKAEPDRKLIIFPEIAGKYKMVSEAISRLTGKSLYELQQIKSFNKDNKYIVLNVENHIPELTDGISRGEYTGVIFIDDYKRYDDKSLARHVIGHIRMSDGVPVAGIEKRFEKYLHPGSQRIVNVFMDAAQHLLPGLGHTVTNPEDPVFDVMLTLDYHIQKILENALDRESGSYKGGVVLDIETGEILALAGRPHYNQSNPLADENANFLAVPLQQHEPGSVFKIIVAAAALEHGGFADRTYICRGGMEVGGNFIACHSRGYGKPSITLKDAFAYSCNDTFIRIAMELGGDAIIDMAKRFGLGSSIDIELNNAPGRLMDKLEYTGAGTSNLAIGQGNTQITLLQAADVIATVCNGGVRKDIGIVKGLVDKSGVMVNELSSDKPASDKPASDKPASDESVREEPVCDEPDRVISEETARTLLNYMGAVTEYGTGTRAQNMLIGGTGGKTGTPEIGGDSDNNEYGWFAGYFPQDKPRYAIVIMCREKGGGGNVAAPIFLETAVGIWEYETRLKEEFH